MKNEKELLKLKREFSPKYILTLKMFEIYLFFILLIGLCILAKKIIYVIFTIVILFLIIFGRLVYEKRKTNQTFMKFFDDRIEFKGSIFFVKTKNRVLKYDEIKDITVTQGTNFFEKRFQKFFGYGNIYVYPKKGNLLTRGMQIELVSDINKKVEKIKEIVGDKIG